MQIREIRWTVAGAAVAAAVAAAMSLAPVEAAPNDVWNANGATACEKFLTPYVMAAVLVKPSGSASKYNAKSCHRGSVYIALSTGTVDVFRRDAEHVAFAEPMTGIGDAAYWTAAGVVSAVKAPDLKCDISVAAAPAEMRLKDGALGQALGGVCNQLFALK